MYHRRINPDKQFINHVLEIGQRVDALETQPSGVIVIREQIKTVDPDTGVETVFGQLPDGTYGLDPFVYDLEPPPIATMPLVNAEPGLFVIAWNGALQGDIPRDFSCVNIIAHKMSGTTTMLSIPVGTIKSPLDTKFVTTDIAAVGEDWQFSLESEDYRSNKAEWGPRSATVTMLSNLNDTVVTEALEALQDDIDAANLNATNAQAAAAAASQEAADAETAALAAANLANTKGKVLSQPTAPTGADQNGSTLWIDTTNNNNTPKRWNGSAWVAVTDKAAIDAAAAAVAAQNSADTAFNAATSAATAAGTAQTTADGKNRVWYQGTAPAGTAHRQNDIWFNTAMDNRVSQWNEATSTWVLQLIGNAAILPNLDAGKITVGTLLAAVIGAKSITTDKLVITSTDNLIVEADFSNNGSSWELSTTKIIMPTAGRGGLPALRFYNTTATQTSLNKVNKISVGSEDRFRGSFWIKSSSPLAAGVAFLKARAYTTATAFTVITIATNTLLTANVPTNIAGISPALSSNVIALEFFLEVTNPTIGTTTDIDYVGLTRAADGKLVVDGTVAAKHLESTMVLTSQVIAGNPAGTHAQMSNLGFKIFSSDPVDGVPNEVVRLGVAATDDYLSVSKADGTSVASISQEGDISGKRIYANNALYYKGQELQSLLNRFPRGVIAAAYREHNAIVNSVAGGPSYGYLRLEVELEQGRIYRVYTNPIRAGLEPNTTLLMGLGYRFDAFADSSNQNTINKVRFTTPESSQHLSELFSFGNYINPKRIVSFIIWFGVDTGVGSGGLRASTDSPVRLMVEDMGLPTSSLNSGVHLDGAVTPASPVNSYVKSYPSWASMNYLGTNAQYNWDTGRMYQGLSPAGYGNLKSISLHPDMTTDLAGANITYIRVYFHFDHWYYNSGGTAIIGVHGHTGIPGSFSHNGAVVSSGGWPKPGARWVDLPSSVFAGFKSGAYRGVTLEGDGTYNTYGFAQRPTIEISYTK